MYCHKQILNTTVECTSSSGPVSRYSCVQSGLVWAFLHMLVISVVVPSESVWRPKTEWIDRNNKELYSENSKSIESSRVYQVSQDTNEYVAMISVPVMKPVAKVEGLAEPTRFCSLQCSASSQLTLHCFRTVGAQLLLN